MTTNYRRFPTYTQALSDFRWGRNNPPLSTLDERRGYYEKTGNLVEYYSTTGAPPASASLSSGFSFPPLPAPALPSSSPFPRSHNFRTILF